MRPPFFWCIKHHVIINTFCVIGNTNFPSGSLGVKYR